MLFITFENGKQSKFDICHKILCSNPIIYTNIDLIDTLEKNDEEIVLLCYTKNNTITKWDFFKKKDAFFYSDGFQSSNANINFTKQDITNFLCSTRKYHLYIDNLPSSDEIIKISNELKNYIVNLIINKNPKSKPLTLTVKDSKLFGNKEIEELQAEDDDFDKDTQDRINKLFYTSQENLSSVSTLQSSESKEIIEDCKTESSEQSTKTQSIPQKDFTDPECTIEQDTDTTSEFIKYKNLYSLKKLQELEELGYSKKMAKNILNKELTTLDDNPESIKKLKKYLGFKSKKQYSLSFDISKVTAKVIVNFLTDHNLDTVTEIWPIVSVLFNSSKVFSFKNKNTADVLIELIECSKGINMQVFYFDMLEKWILCSSLIDQKDTDTILELFNIDGKFDALVLLKINDNYINTYGIIQNITFAEELDSKAFNDWHTILLDQISTNVRIFTKEQKHKLLKNYSRVFTNILDIGDVDIHIQIT